MVNPAATAHILSLQKKAATGDTAAQTALALHTAASSLASGAGALPGGPAKPNATLPVGGVRTDVQVGTPSNEATIEQGILYGIQTVNVLDIVVSDFPRKYPMSPHEWATAAFATMLISRSIHTPVLRAVATTGASGATPDASFAFSANNLTQLLPGVGLRYEGIGLELTVTVPGDGAPATIQLNVGYHRADSTPIVRNLFIKVNAGVPGVIYLIPGDANAVGQPFPEGVQAQNAYLAKDLGITAQTAPLTATIYTTEVQFTGAPAGTVVEAELMHPGNPKLPAFVRRFVHTNG